MKIPKFIKPGDTIAITAPSFGATIEPYITRFNEAIKIFKERGYEVIVGKTCYLSDGVGISTNPKTAAQELTDFYLDPKIKAIISCGGGELMCETISHIDFYALKQAEPKWFVGYSDNTNFIFPLVTLCETCAIYAQNATGFGKPWERSEQDTFEILEGKKNTVFGFEKFQNPNAQIQDPLSPYILTEQKTLKTFVPDASSGKNLLQELSDEKDLVMSGIILGGCLDCIVGLSGTRFDGVKNFVTKHKKIIWALESCDLNPMDIRRALWHLKESGWFKNAAGFIFGRPYAAFDAEIFGLNQYNAVTGALCDLKVPLVLDADFGHIDPVFPLVIGADSKIFVRGNDIKIEMGLTR
ncbi:LD-carboxypeptidase [Treponema pectinovorum]|uniref:S66 family peptidase n=1 Tax=Treponema pectinovorum TaxID=164 RepID=UPI003D8B9B5A